MLTMCLCGLWHGAAWTFIAWGMYHGFLLIIHKFWRECAESSPVLIRVRSLQIWRFFSITLMFIFTLFGWLIFRVSELNELKIYFSTDALRLSSSEVFGSLVLFSTVLVYSCPLLISFVFQPLKKRFLNNKGRTISYQQILILIIFSLTVLLVAQATNDFIYFQF